MQRPIAVILPMIPALILAVVLALTVAAPATAQEAQPDVPMRPTANSLFLPLVTGGAGALSEVEIEDDLPTMLVRIHFDSAEELQGLADRLDIWEVDRSAGTALVLVTGRQRDGLAAAGWQVELDMARTAQMHAQVQAASGADVAAIPGYTCYRTVEETYASLAALAASKPNLATWTDIGDSWEKVTPGGKAGYDIMALKLTNSARPGPKPKFLLMGAIHAREYTTAELATRFAEELVAKHNVDPDVTWLLDNFELHVIPQANPDGRKLAEAGSLWRKNTDSDDGCRRSSQLGTDLNRNSSFKWNTGGSSGKACDETYRGPSAASEPEVKAVEAYATAIFPDQRGPNDTDAALATAEGLFISLHSYSELVLFPWGWTTSPAPNSTQLQTLGRKFGFFNGYQVCNGPACLYATSGTTDDYTYGKLGIASYTIELGRNFFESCSFFTSNIVPKNVPALYYAFKATRRPYENPSGPEALSVSVSPATVPAGTSVNLTAVLNDTRYNSNGWGTEPTQNIAAGRYSVDQPLWATAALSNTMTAADGSFNSGVENVTATINTTNWAAGRHIVFVEGQDANGNWGVPTAVFVNIVAP
jgi:hypothetical protein